MAREQIDTQFILYQLRRNGINNRNDIVKVLRSNDFTSFEANKVMEDAGLGGLTRAERSGFKKINKGQIGEGVVRNLKEIAASFPTLIAGAVIEAPRLLKNLGKAELAGREELPSKQEQQAIRSLSVAGPDVINTALNLPFGQYNITTERVGGTFKGLKDKTYKGPKLSLDDILYGVSDNPLYAGMDFLTLGGGKALKGIGNAYSKTALGKRRSALKDFNKMLNTANLEAEKALAKQEPLIKQFNREWLSLPDEARIEISRALQQTGQTKLSNPEWDKALRLARVSSKRSSRAMINEGLITKEENANNIIANYIGNNMGWGEAQVSNPAALQEFLKSIGADDKSISQKLPSNTPRHTDETRAALARDERIVADGLGISPRAVRMNKNKKWLAEKDMGLGDLEAKATGSETFEGGSYVNYEDITKTVEDALNRLRENNYKIQPYNPQEYEWMKFKREINKGINKYAKNPTAENLNAIEEYMTNNVPKDGIDWDSHGADANTLLQEEFNNLYKAVDGIENAKNQTRTISGINHDKILKWIEKPETMPKEIKPLFEQGKKLQKQGRLAFITQKVHPAVGIQGQPLERAASYHEQQRFYGTRTPEEMAEYLPEALAFQADQTGKARALKTFMGRLNEYDPQLKKIKKDTNFYSTKNIGGYVNDQLAMGKKLNEIIMGLPRATEKEIKAGEALALPKEERTALLRFSAGRGGNEYLNMFKRAVLASPKWTAENMEQAALGNIIEGVTPLHAVKALGSLVTGNYPREIDTLTKAYGYAGNRPSGVLRSLGEGLNRMWLGLRGTFTHGVKGEPTKALRSLGEIPLGLADAYSNPIFTFDAFADKVMRLSNYEKQVDDLAKGLKVDRKEVRELANKNPEVFESLYSAVNTSLGDYTSRNYMMPKVTQDVLEVFSPFWRFPYNTAKTTGYQLTEKPIGSQLMTVLPSKAGRDLWYEKSSDVDKEMVGGYPTGKTHPTSGRETMVTTESHPLTAVIHQLGSFADIGASGPEEFTRGINPIAKLNYPLTLRNAFGNPAVTENWGISRDPATGRETLFKRDKETGLPIYEEQNLSPLEYADWLTRQGLKQYYYPTVHTMNEGRRMYYGLFKPVQRALTSDLSLQQALEQATMYPAYDDAINPLSEGNVSANPTVGAGAILSPILGIREVVPYAQSEQSKRNAYKSMAKKLSKRKTPFLEGYVEYNVNK